MSTALCAVLTESESEGVSIARALRERNANACNALVERYGTRLIRYLTHLTGERALAEDLFQETWVRVLERGRQYRSDRPFVAWLLSIARNLAVDLLRKKRPLSLDALESPEEGGGPRSLARSSGPSPFDTLAAREQQDRVTAVVAGLPAAYRELLFLRFTEEMSLQEIARVTGLALPTVKSRLYRGLAHLAARLGAAARASTSGGHQ
jgi:RNA polymerase sigma-70 factor, ECF subfamily